MVSQSPLLCCLVLALVVSGIQCNDSKSEDYHREVDKLIEKSIHDFEHAQNEKMKAGFTSDARRSYKKTKYSLAMEARNEIFKTALTSLQNLFPDTNENELAKNVLQKMPSHFDAFGAKRTVSSTEGPPYKTKLSERDLPNACHGFPLHLPGHVEPCRDNVNIQCNENDQRIRRINGECNNLNNKRWGAQVSPLQRLLPRQHEKFQIPLHEDLNDDPSGRKKMKRQPSGNGDELVGEWEATQSGTIITCVRKPSNNNHYTCSWGNNEATVRWQLANVGIYTWNNYPSVTGIITNNLMTWSTGSKWRKKDIVPFCHSDCAPKDCQNSTASLPNARFASATLHNDANMPENNVTNLLMQFAQFVDHDISLSPEATTTDCCKNPYQDECMAILIPENDVFFRQLNNQTCMQFTRSVPYCPESIDSCTKRENMNIISGLLDTSNVYGSDTTTANCLRSFKDGKLLVDENGLLPVAGDVQAGDARAPEMPALSAMHALWMREHNRICDRLKDSIPPHLSTPTDEYLYQNARRILNAEFQNVVYGEQIPIVEGPDSVNKYNLGISVDGTTYKPTVNPSILAEFSTASNRYGHSLVQGMVDVHNVDLSFNHTYQLADNFLNPAEYQGDGFDRIIAGLTQQPTQKFDRWITKDLTEKMFRGILTPPGSDYGLDLASLNIQRGRDHGLPSYYELYNLVGDQSDPRKDMSCWQRRPKSFDPWNWALLKQVYRHPRDIELFSGGLLDKRPNGINANPILGSMFSIINSLQFSRLKDGDRFFFTHTNGAAGFNRAARQAIMDRKISDIICDNTKVEKVPKNAFLPQNTNGNPLVICGSHTPLNLGAINLINV